MARQGLPVPSLPLVDDAKLVGEGEAFLLAGQRLLVPAEPLVDNAEVGQAAGLAEAVAQLPVKGQARLVVAERSVILAAPQVSAPEVVVGPGLGGAVADPAGGLEGGLAGLHTVLPVASDAEVPEQGLGELDGDLGVHAGGGCGLPDSGQQIGPLGLQPPKGRLFV